MTIAIWSYPGQDHFTAVQGSLSRHRSFQKDQLRGSFLISPYQHTEHGFFSLSTQGAERVTSAGRWLKDKEMLFPNKGIIEPLPEYRELVALAVSELKANNPFKKVVLSRYKEVKHEGINPHWPDHLKRAYPNAFVSLISDDNLGTWLMASPELYLKSEGPRKTSFSLAGTKYGQNGHLGSKEKVEQSIVTDFIHDAFRQSGLQVNLKKGVEYQAGDLTHLLTVVEGMASDAFDLETLALGLHPTPAVCGVPREWARSFINFEGYDRQLYTGFLGEYSNEDRFELYVNLRSAQLFEHKVRLYAGAGITAESVPEGEFLETEAKMGVLQSVLLSQQ